MAVGVSLEINATPKNVNVNTNENIIFSDIAMAIHRLRTTGRNAAAKCPIGPNLIPMYSIVFA